MGITNSSLPAWGLKARKRAHAFKVLGKLTQAGPIPQGIRALFIAVIYKLRTRGLGLLCELGALAGMKSLDALRAVSHIAKLAKKNVRLRLWTTKHFSGVRSHLRTTICSGFDWKSPCSLERATCLRTGSLMSARAPGSDWKICLAYWIALHCGDCTAKKSGSSDIFIGAWRPIWQSPGQSLAILV